MDEPVRKKPDYNEQEFRAEDKKALEEETRVAQRFVSDYRDGIFRELPLKHETYEDCLIEYGAEDRISDPHFMRRVAEIANRQVALFEHRKVAVRKNTLPVHLAAAFARAIEDGRLPRLDHYTVGQATDFVRGAIGDGPETKRILRDFAVAHNVTNEELGVIEVEANKIPFLVEGQMNFVKSYLDQMGDFQEERDAAGSLFYPMDGEGSQRLWNLVRTIETNFPEMTASVENEGQQMHILVRENVYAR